MAFDEFVFFPGSRSLSVQSHTHTIGKPSFEKIKSADDANL